MSKSYFMMFSTDPDVDPRKCIVGLACTAQAIADGHKVVAFFASHAVKLLQSEYINTFDAKVAEGEIDVELWTKDPEVVANAQEKDRSFNSCRNNVASYPLLILDSITPGFDIQFMVFSI